MDATLLDWLGLGLRWFHLVVAIGWIGTSFYFMWLDSSIRPPETPREGVDGEVWMVHSGHFYQVEMRRLRPGEVPSVLHWFKWEAALTWMSGVGLLAVVYYLTGGVYLIDPNVSKITTGGRWPSAWGSDRLVAGLRPSVGVAARPRPRRGGHGHLLRAPARHGDPRLSDVERARRLHPRGGRAGHHHGGQRVDAHHSRAARADRRDAERAGRRTGPCRIAPSAAPSTTATSPCPSSS